jgi:hypothetical protein
VPGFIGADASLFQRPQLHKPLPHCRATLHGDIRCVNELYNSALSSHLHKQRIPAAHNPELLHNEHFLRGHPLQRGLRPGNLLPNREQLLVQHDVGVSAVTEERHLQFLAEVRSH